MWLLRAFLSLAALAVAWLGWYAWTLSGASPLRAPDPTLVAAGTALARSATPWIAPSRPPNPVTPSPAPTHQGLRGTLLYAARRAGYFHIWSYATGEPGPVQWTYGDWDDRSPALSPDGGHLAFTSNRDGAWDIYLMDVQKGSVRRLTQTAAAEGDLTWSPDGAWIAFEASDGTDYDIWIMPLEGGQEVFQLTDYIGRDQSPSWDPAGRRIAFVSDRDGGMDIFLADLDRPDERFKNLTNTPDEEDLSPVFSPDGSELAYSTRQAGLDILHIQPLDDLSREPQVNGQGRQAAWSPDGSVLAATLPLPLETQVVAYAVRDGALLQTGFPLRGDLVDLEWVPDSVPGEVYARAAEHATPTALYEVVRQGGSDAFGRIGLEELPGVHAPNASLSDDVDEAFNALRARAAQALGWDFLSTLGSAFVGLNEPLPPGIAYDDWLYTGRAFAISQDAVQAGWVQVVREDFGGATYWRVFVRAATQDGSIGAPLREPPWDFDARFRGDPTAYDQGGAPMAVIPKGYYVDFTRLAADYGFERLPAMPNWRTYYYGARFDEFVYRGGLDWTQAMLQLYPAEALRTPTPFRTPTTTPTRTPRPTPTPWWWRWRTPTPSPTFAPPTPFATPTPG